MSPSSPCLRPVAPAVAEALLGQDAEQRAGRASLGFLISSEYDFEIHPLLRISKGSSVSSPAIRRPTSSSALIARTSAAQWDAAFSVERFFDRDLLVELFEAGLPPMLLDARLPTLARWVGVMRVEGSVDAPVVDLAEGELAFRAGTRTRSEALGLQAARRFGAATRLTSRPSAWKPARAPACPPRRNGLGYFATGLTKRKTTTPQDKRYGVGSSRHSL